MPRRLCWFSWGKCDLTANYEDYFGDSEDTEGSGNATNTVSLLSHGCNRDAESCDLQGAGGMKSKRNWVSVSHTPVTMIDAIRRLQEGSKMAGIFLLSCSFTRQRKCGVQKSEGHVPFFLAYVHCCFTREKKGEIGS